MIIGTLKISPLPDRRDGVIEVLRSVQGPVRALSGCVAFDVWVEQDADFAIVVTERWESQEAFDAHIRSETYRRLLEAIEFSGCQPDIRFEHVSVSGGMEVVERLRHPGETTSAADSSDDPRADNRRGDKP
jgi:quinol monooxygenase YgiN